MGWYWWLLIIILCLCIVSVFTLHIWSSVNGPKETEEQDYVDLDKQIEIDSIHDVVCDDLLDVVWLSDSKENFTNDMIDIHFIQYLGDVNVDLDGYKYVFICENRNISMSVPLALKRVYETQDRCDDMEYVCVSRWLDRECIDPDLNLGVLTTVEHYKARSNSNVCNYKSIECHTRPEFAHIDFM